MNTNIYTLFVCKDKPYILLDYVVNFTSVIKLIAYIHDFLFHRKCKYYIQVFHTTNGYAYYYDDERTQSVLNTLTPEYLSQFDKSL